MRCPVCGNLNREGARFCDSCGTELAAAAEAAPPAPGGARQPDSLGAGELPDGAPASVGGGRYLLKRFLGEGARKRVYLAEDTADSGEVAVALFDTHGVAAAVQARARREADAMHKLGENPYVIRVHDSGEEAGSPYIVSEYMAGGDVRSLLAEEGRLELERAIRIASDVALALEHAHSCRIVHRDLKPANVWLDDDGRARLGDFGLATTEGRSRVGGGGTLVGTVAYLPPEQALGEPSGPPSDLYSLGALLYEMLTGEPPFPGDDAVSIIGQHLHADPVPPSRHNPEVPEALDAAVLRLLAKRPEDRFADAAAAREALEAALDAPPGPLADETAEGNPLDRLAGGVFVGRERELEELRAAADAAVAGHGGLLMLVGEPGIGKTRAAEELATYAQLRGARVHWGRCREDEGAPAYWPWVQAIRSYVRDADPVALAWQMGAGAAEIAKLVPEVAERLEIEPASESEGEQARFRLFDAVTSFLVATSRDRPLVLILDDLHWADEPSLLLLEFAARELGDGGLLIVGAYRDVELGRHHPLARVLGELAGMQQGRRVTLRGLGVDAVHRYIEMASGQPAAPGLADAIHAQTEGNPFFVGEIVRLLASEGRLSEGPGSWEPVIPQGVREVLGRRLDRLSEETNEALRVAAAIGREFDVELVVRAADLSLDELLDAAGEAIAERLVSDGGPGRFTFSHALVRDTLYDELNPNQRARIHARIAQALEEICGGDPDPKLGELAHHFLAAGALVDVERAIAYAERAGRRAMTKLAYEDATEVYERALEALDLLEDPPNETRCRLLLCLGEAETAAGRFVDARRALEEAAACAREEDDTDSFVRAVLDLGQLSETGFADERLIALAEEGLERIGPEERSGRRALLTSMLSQELYWVDAQGRSAPLAAEAAEIAREAGDDRALANALNRQFFIPYGPDSNRERLAIAQEMVGIGERSGDRETLMLGHVYLLREYLERGEIEAMDRELETYARLAEELRMPQHIWHIYALRATRAMIEGRFDDAERLAGEARRRGERAEQPLAQQIHGVQLLIMRRFQGRGEELLDSVRELAERYPAIPAWRVGMISLEAWVGNLDRAREELERMEAAGASLVRDINWLTGTGLLAETVVWVGDVARAEALYDELLPYDGLVVIAGRAAGSNGPVSRLLGLLARTVGRLDDAERHLTDAIELARRMGDRPYAALSQVELAAALLQRDRPGDRGRALELLGEALGDAREFKARAIVERGLALRLEAQGLAGVDVTTSIDDVVSALETERPDLRAHAAPDGTVAILFSDIEDSTLLTERLGDERWLEVLREHNNLFREQIARHSGYEVKSQGDGFMLAFPDPRQALGCAVAVQRALAEREREGTGEPLRVRIGLHTGEVIAEEGDFFGKNVILSARIASQAAGGEILVSERMRQAVEQPRGQRTAGERTRGQRTAGVAVEAGAGSAEAGGLRFDEGRELKLKGLAGTHRVFRAEWEPQTAPTR